MSDAATKPCPNCQSPTDSWLCDACKSVLYFDWRIAFCPCKKKQGVADERGRHGDYRCAIWRNGRWVETAASRQCPDALAGRRLNLPRCGE